MDNININQTMSSMFQGLDSIISTKTVIGEPQVIGDTIILPLVDVSFGMGAGALGREHSNSGAGGIGGKMIPTAILVIRNGEIRMIPVHSQDALDTISKAIDMVPSTVNKIVSLINNQGQNDPELDAALKKADISGNTIKE